MLVRWGVCGGVREGDGVCGVPCEMCVVPQLGCTCVVERSVLIDV